MHPADGGDLFLRHAQVFARMRPNWSLPNVDKSIPARSGEGRRRLRRSRYRNHRELEVLVPITEAGVVKIAALQKTACKCYEIVKLNDDALLHPANR